MRLIGVKCVFLVGGECFARAVFRTMDGARANCQVIAPFSSRSSAQRLNELHLKCMDDTSLSGSVFGEGARRVAEQCLD